MQVLPSCAIRAIRKGNTPIYEYLQNIRLLCNALAAIGDTLTDADIVHTALDGLPKEYRPFVVSVENLPILLSFNQLCAKLLTYEQRLSLDAEIVPASDSSIQASVTQL